MDAPTVGTRVRKAVITAAGRGTRQYPASTTVQKTGPPDPSSGGPRVLLERARRFLGECDGGQKDRRRLTQALKPWDKRARQPQELRIVPAGARR